MSFSGAINAVLTNYANFQGRAVRSEFWYWGLFSVLVQFGFMIVGYLVHWIPIIHFIVSLGGFLFWLAVLVPSIAVTVRRLHDIDRSGWWYFIGLVPLVGFILLLVWFCTPGTRGPNRFGGGGAFAGPGPMPMPVGFN